MENQKDNKHQITTNDKTSISQERPDLISLFNKDKSFVFVYKKTEKLATAMYMITNLFSDIEPIKWSLRKKVAELLSFIVGYKNILPAQHLDFADEVKTRILEIVSLFEISYCSGLVSPMNFSIMREEFSVLIHSIENTKDTNSGLHRETISESFFNTQNTTVDISKKDVNFQTRTNPTQTNSLKDRPSEAGVFNRNNRQNIIIGLLKKKNDLTIKDIALTIKDCSEKTIQRELISLISAGVIKKTGDRRWSRYSLN